jgi:hypothetical protein
MSQQDDGDETFDDGELMHEFCVCGSRVDKDGLCEGCNEIEEGCTCAVA